MRLTAVGLDYSPAYTGKFPLHVDWALAMESQFRQGSNNSGFVWCLYAPVVDGIDPLPAFIPRDWPLGRRQVRAEMRYLTQACGVDKRSPEQTAAILHLVFFGTPIVLNLAFATGAPLKAVDAYLREHTGGLCTFEPTGKSIPPTLSACCLSEHGV